MSDGSGFQPRWSSPTGETIRDALLERNITVDEFAQMIGRTTESTTEVLQGQVPITLELARELQTALGSSVSFWMDRDYQYQDATAGAYSDPADWLRALPVAEMVQFGWIPRVSTDQERLRRCLEFFGVDTVDAWHRIHGTPAQAAAFRLSGAFSSSPGAIAAWLRAGELEATGLECDEWDADAFQVILPELRPLTRMKDPARFLPELQARCARAGVAVVVVRAPAGCPASGATRFFSNSNALLQLSFRYLTDDHFWFSFFHEAAHLVLHHERLRASVLLGEASVILESDSSAGSEEDEANSYAEQVLVPSAAMDTLLAVPHRTADIVRFAVRIGIAPGIVVGQMQHRNMIGFDRFNRLKRRFVWQDD